MPLIDQPELANLVGLWRGSGLIHPNPWGAGGSATAEWTFDWDADRIHLIGHYAEQRSGGQAFNGFGVLCDDREAQRLAWFFFDTYGFPPNPPATGRLDGGVLTLEKETARGVGRTVFTFAADGFTQSVSSRLAGAAEFSPVADLTFQRG